LSLRLLVIFLLLLKPALAYRYIQIKPIESIPDLIQYRYSVCISQNGGPKVRSVQVCSNRLLKILNKELEKVSKDFEEKLNESDIQLFKKNQKLWEGYVSSQCDMQVKHYGMSMDGYCQLYKTILRIEELRKL